MSGQGLLIKICYYRDDLTVKHCCLGAQGFPMLMASLCHMRHWHQVDINIGPSHLTPW